MARFWDIRPPRRRRESVKRKEEKRRRKSSLNFLFFIIIIGAIAVLFFGLAKNLPITTPETTPTATKTPTSSPSITPTGPQIKILNGTGRVEEGTAVKKILSDNGFQVATTENALNIYEQTIVYYQADDEKIATQIAGLLKNYNAKTQKFTQETKFDIVVVIGGE